MEKRNSLEKKGLRNDVKDDAGSIITLAMLLSEKNSRNSCEERKKQLRFQKQLKKERSS